MQLKKFEMQLFSVPAYHKGNCEKTDKSADKSPKPNQKIKERHNPKFKKIK